MKESKNNIHLVCKGCLADKKAETQVHLKSKLQAAHDHGTFYVKKSFLDGEDSEAMWVKVETMVLNKGVITGTLSNDPQVVKNVKDNDIVTVMFDEIIEIYTK